MQISVKVNGTERTADVEPRLLLVHLVRDTFGLVLIPDRPKRQTCEVVWRRGKTYGVKFLT